MKFCTRKCPKCGVPLTHDPRKPAKGTKHFKENPECLKEIPNLIPLEVSDEMIQKNLGFESNPFV
jgi:hypothetical protein